MFRVVLRGLVAMAAVAWATSAALAGVLIKVDLGGQRMTVEVDGKLQHSWSVSTARTDYVTPTGSYRPQRMHRMWYSRKYDMAPMPYAIFYSGGYAIHGTTSVGMLGRPASHGCVRLAPANAAALFTLVQRKGMAATRIVIHGTPPRPPKPAPALAQRAPQPPLQRTAAAPAWRQSEPGLLSGMFGWSEPSRARLPAPRRQIAVAAPQDQQRRPLRPLPAKVR